MVLVNDLNLIFVLLLKQKEKHKQVYLHLFLLPFFSDYIWTKTSTYRLGEAPFAKTARSSLTPCVTVQHAVKASPPLQPPSPSNHLQPHSYSQQDFTSPPGNEGDGL